MIVEKLSGKKGIYTHSKNTLKKLTNKLFR